MIVGIGVEPDTAQVLAIPGVHLHAYGKAARPGRKLGHATLRAENARALHAGLDPLLALASPVKEAHDHRDSTESRVA